MASERHEGARAAGSRDEGLDSGPRSRAEQTPGIFLTRPGGEAVPEGRTAQGLDTAHGAPTVYPQRVVVVNLQAEEPGRPRAPERQAGFLGVVEGLQGAGVGGVRHGGTPGEVPAGRWGLSRLGSGGRQLAYTPRPF